MRNRLFRFLVHNMNFRRTGSIILLFQHLLLAFATTATAAESPAPLPLVILLGDSIRKNYQATVHEKLAGRAEVWSPRGNHKHTQYTLENLEKWLTAAGRDPEVIHINVGLHDMYLNADTGEPRHDIATYEKNLRAIFAKLHKLTDAKIIFALTTVVDEDRQAKSKGYGRIVRRNEDIDRYNARVREIAAEMDITLNDLNAFMKKSGPGKILLSSDGIHLSPEGCKALGAAVADAITRELPE